MKCRCIEEGASVENECVQLDTDIILPFTSFEKCGSFGFNFVSAEYVLKKYLLLD